MALGGPTIQVFRSRNRFGNASGGTLVLTSPAAASVPLTINAHAAQSGDLILVQQSDGTDRLRVTSNFALVLFGAGTVATSGIQTHGIDVRANSTTEVTFLSARQFHADSRAALQLINDGGLDGQLLIGGSNTSSPSTIVRNKIGIRGGTSLGIFLYTASSGVPIQFYAGSTTESARFHDGDFRLGGSLTTGLGKLQVVGDSDEIQEVIRANGTQTAVVTAWQNSAGTTVASISAAFRLFLNNGTTTSKLTIGPLAVAAASGIEAYIESSATGTGGLRLKAIAAQTANHLETQDSSGNNLTYIGPTGRVFVKVPTTAPADGDLVNGSMSWWLDEATPAVKAKVKDSGGTVRTLTITNGASPTYA